MEAAQQPGTEKPALMPVRSLAYMGDAIYELHVRERMLRGGQRVETLHKATVAHVSAAGQAALTDKLLPLLRTDEQDIFRRARNHKGGGGSRRVSGRDYQLSTAFEAVLGYLYLGGERDRLREVLAQVDALSLPPTTSTDEESR